jgi:hypothetical protein
MGKPYPIDAYLKRKKKKNVHHPEATVQLFITNAETLDSEPPRKAQRFEPKEIDIASL